LIDWTPVGAIRHLGSQGPREGTRDLSLEPLPSTGGGSAVTSGMKGKNMGPNSGVKPW